MLIYLDAAMLEEPERKTLSRFFRKPFTDESCALVASGAGLSGAGKLNADVARWNIVVAGAPG
ncbi:hypothetical protein [Janthinobacterium agaricidamnosum]|uniref:hypothetical protein n=1 Tax=Janthinobacterium agaricidamnosum TaxID=55508 RepID=UPI0013CF0B87|nr:hypothetical protein [Janthinobacterium agaricidamnosum]